MRRTGPTAAHGHHDQAFRALLALRRPPRSWAVVCCDVMASPFSASHAVQSSPCVACCWRQRYKVRHARLLVGDSGTKFAMHAKNAPKRAISSEQGEFCTAHAVRRGVLGEFCTGSGPARFLLGEFCLASAPPLFPVAVLPLPAAQRCGQAVQSPPVSPASQYLLHWWRWGLCTFRSWLSACRRRVTPLMTPFPRLVAESCDRADCDGRRVAPSCSCKCHGPNADPNRMRLPWPRRILVRRT